MDKLRRHFGLLDPIGETANILDNLHMKPSDFYLQCGLYVLCLPIRLGEWYSVLSLLPGAPQLDPGSYLYPETRETYLIPEYVCFSNNY